MFKNKEKLYQVYHMVLCLALAWTLALIINQYFELKVSILLCAIYSLVPSLLIYLFDMNKRNVASYLLLFSTLPIVALLFLVKKLNPISWIQDLIAWCASYNGTEELYIGHFANVVVFTVCVLGALLFYLITKKQLFKIILAIFIMGTMIFLSIRKVDINKAAVGICIFYILTIVVELYGIAYSRKLGKQDKKEGILYLAPICLLLAVLSISLPSKQDPIQWNSVKRAYNNIVQQINTWKTELDYYYGKSNSEFRFTGYSEESGKLGDGKALRQNSKIALKVSGRIASNPVYLIGSINDVYTGSSWEKSRQDYIPEEMDYMLDYSELIYAMSRQDTKLFENNRYINRRILKIKYSDIKTKTFFYPIKMSGYEVMKKKDKVLAERSNVLFDKARGKGTTYESYFYEMNLQGEAFKQMLREADTFSYDSADNFNSDSLLWLKNNIIYNDDTKMLLTRWDFKSILKARAELIKTQYTKLPDTLPDRVKNLAKEITEESDTTYDKLKAIEDYLHTYQYTLQPKGMPAGEDFTDYFLFQNKEGYCTSYATAMAVLGRCIGVPTRYVEGFVANFEQRDEEEMFPVMNSQAHAWAEAYIEGVGWIPFEATAPFFDSRYTTWLEFTKQEEAKNNVIIPYEQFMQDQIDITGLNTNSLHKGKKDTASDILKGFLIVLSAILILLVLFILYYLVLRYYDRETFQKMDYSKKMYMTFLRIITLLKKEGFAIGQQETILMLSRRVKNKLDFNQVTFPEVAAIYMRYRYGEEAITRKEFDQTRTYHLGLLNKQKKEQSWLKIWLEEFIYLARKGIS